jgi:hypothetical protein
LIIAVALAAAVAAVDVMVRPIGHRYVPRRFVVLAQATVMCTWWIPLMMMMMLLMLMTV